MNVLIDNEQCPVCKQRTKGNFHDCFTYDYERAELYCDRCGTVLIDSQIPTLQYLEEYHRIKDKPKPRPKPNDFQMAFEEWRETVRQRKEMEKQKAKERRQRKKELKT